MGCGLEARLAVSALPGVLDHLRASQSAAGGWGYQAQGPSWIEPTCLALLALSASGSGSECEAEFRRGLRWLLGQQRPDGGFPPCAGVAHSTWVTALATLVLTRAGESAAVRPAVAWMLAQTGQETSLAFRLRNWLLGVREEYQDPDSRGWPWFPGSAAWVCPTAFAILALRSLRGGQADPRSQERVRLGQRFLLSRMCADGGWNHGSARSLGYEGNSYPETTGIALLALSGLRSPQLDTAAGHAHQQLRTTTSREARQWLRLGLLAHGRDIEFEVSGRDEQVVAAALAALVLCTPKGGNAFLDGNRGEGGA